MASLAPRGKTIARKSQYKAGGWTGFDPAADVYIGDDLCRARGRRDL